MFWCGDHVRKTVITGRSTHNERDVASQALLSNYSLHLKQMVPVNDMFCLHFVFLSPRFSGKLELPPTFK